MNAHPHASESFAPAVTKDAASRRVLLALLYFGAASSAVGAVMGVFANGGPVPLGYLDGTPFTGYVIPGLILGVIVGGTQLAGVVALQLRRPSAPAWAAVAGFGMVIWIFVELAMLREYSFLQAIYFALGLAELVAVLLPRIIVRRDSHVG